MKGLLVGLLVLASTSHRGGAARVVQIPADGLRLGNALSRWSGCYKIARTAGLEFRATGSPVCGAFVGLPGCHAGSLAQKTTKIPLEPAWWLDIMEGETFPVEDSHIEVPDSPGLGVTFIPEEAKKYLREEDKDFFDE